MRKVNSVLAVLTCQAGRHRGIGQDGSANKSSGFWWVEAPIATTPPRDRAESAELLPNRPQSRSWPSSSDRFDPEKRTKLR